jgi:hypothetical protein
MNTVTRTYVSLTERESHLLSMAISREVSRIESERDTLIAAEGDDHYLVADCDQKIFELDQLYGHLNGWENDIPSFSEEESEHIRQVGYGVA